MNAITQLYELIKNSNAQPMYFGLGFIQLKINDNERFHFYHPELLPIVNIEEEVHNHRYDFISEVIIGQLNNKIYHFTPDQQGMYIKEQESCNENIKLPQHEKLQGNIILFNDLLIKNKEKYFMDHRTFHTVSSNRCMTKLIRSSYMKNYAEVIRPIQSQKTCPFSKKMTIEQCWDIIEEIMLKNKK